MQRIAHEEKSEGVVMFKRLAMGILAIALSGCMNYTPSQLNGTAQALGCYPYGYLPPKPTATVAPDPTMPTAVTTSTPAPTWSMCTPEPLTPTLTPTPLPTATPWVRPTELPAIQRDTPPVNISNMAGYDIEPSIAVHPTEGWAAVVWANWVWEFPNEATVFVKVQGTESAWNAAQGVNTGSVTKGAGAPAITIGADGRIHVIYAGEELLRYTYSDDRGRTWSDPATVLTPSGTAGVFYPQIWLDAANTLHVMYTSTDCFDCFHYGHSSFTNGAWSYQDRLTPGAKQLFGDGTSVTLPDGTIRTIAAVGCRLGCAHGAGVQIATRDGTGAWVTRNPPSHQTKRVTQVIQWVDMIHFRAANEQTYLCVAWGQYSQSAVHNSCSTDYGITWGETEIIAHHSETVDQAPQATSSVPTPTIDPASGQENDGDQGSSVVAKNGFHPELIYVPQFDQLMAVWFYFEADVAGSPSTIVYSYRPLDSTAWTPFMDEADNGFSPPFRLFKDTRRSAARNPRVAMTKDGLAKVTWIEIERDESIEVYYGVFFAPALVAREK